MITKNATALNRKANKCEVTGIASRPGVYTVKSPSGSTYQVDLNRGGECTCQWDQRGGAGCSHEMAARKFHAETTEHRAISFQPGDASMVARQQHKVARPVAVGKDGSVSLVVRDKIPEQKPEPLPRSVLVAFLWDRWDPPTILESWTVREVWVDDGGWRKSRKPLQDVLEQEGWTVGQIKLVRPNQVPGWHRFEFEMRR